MKWFVIKNNFKKEKLKNRQKCLKDFNKENILANIIRIHQFYLKVIQNRKYN
jgi:hypothetical protein